MSHYKRYTITSALPYANGPIHIGHMAGVYVPADIYARYLRQRGEDVLFIGGSDEHGVPITIRAKDEKTTPQAIVDRYHGIIKKSFEEFGISFDVYSRTSATIHHESAKEYFKHLFDKGEFIEKESEQFYDPEVNEFLADRYVKGECPNCGNPEAYGDQCENCGSTLSPDELKNPKSALSGADPIKKSTKHWYLPLDKHEAWLMDWVNDHKSDWKANVYGQVKSWLDSGLKPRAVTRDLDWGVPVPVDSADGKVLYVWFDAPIGYISATKQWAKEKGKDWEPYWKDESSRLIHFIGKDNIVFHCIIFPAMLKAHGDYILPDNVPANEFLNLEGNKLSTSRNWAVWLHEYLEDFPGKQDVLRYTLCANMPETKDNDFTWKDFQARNNNELVAILGNFVNRAIVLTHKYYEGKVPALGECFDLENELKSAIIAAPQNIASSMDAFRFRDALSELMDLARAGNKFLAETEPWHLIKTDPSRVETIMNLSLQVVANLRVLCQSFLPETAKKLGSILNLEEQSWDKAGLDNLLETGKELNKAELLFEKIEDEAIEKQVARLRPKEEKKKESKMSEEKASISFDDFTKLDLRTGTILSAEKVEKTDKLLKLAVKLGQEVRTVVSGIAGYYDPANIVGQQVVMVTNLEPRKIRGIESKGMILMAEDNDGSLAFVAPDKEIADGGSVS